jgi:alpha-N-arabinofuranosidase
VQVDSPTHPTDKYGEADSIVAAATHDEANGDLVLFVANRSVADPITLELDLAGAFAGHVPVGHRILHEADPDAFNSAARPDAVTPRDIAVTAPLTIEPISWNVIRCAARPT